MSTLLAPASGTSGWRVVRARPGSSQPPPPPHFPPFARTGAAAGVRPALMRRGDETGGMPAGLGAARPEESHGSSRPVPAARAAVNRAGAGSVGAVAGHSARRWLRGRGAPAGVAPGREARCRRGGESWKNLTQAGDAAGTRAGPGTGFRCVAGRAAGGAGGGAARGEQGVPGGFRVIPDPGYPEVAGGSRDRRRLLSAGAAGRRGTAGGGDRAGSPARPPRANSGKGAGRRPAQPRAAGAGAGPPRSGVGSASRRRRLPNRERTRP
jgi:hypothetical protein